MRCVVGGWWAGAMGGVKGESWGVVMRCAVGERWGERDKLFENTF